MGVPPVETLTQREFLVRIACNYTWLETIFLAHCICDNCMQWDIDYGTFTL